MNRVCALMSLRAFNENPLMQICKPISNMASVYFLSDELLIIVRASDNKQGRGQG